jgi:hypothetical protein
VTTPSPRSTSPRFDFCADWRGGQPAWAAGRIAYHRSQQSTNGYYRTKGGTGAGLPSSSIRLIESLTGSCSSH